MQIKHIDKAKTSATTVEAQIPFILNNNGKINTQAIWNTNVLAIETIAEIKPLFSAVKKEEVNTFIPENINDIEYILIAFVVKFNNSSFFPTNMQSPRNS